MHEWKVKQDFDEDSHNVMFANDSNFTYSNNPITSHDPACSRRWREFSSVQRQLRIHNLWVLNSLGCFEITDSDSGIQFTDYDRKLVKDRLPFNSCFPTIPHLPRALSSGKSNLNNIISRGHLLYAYQIWMLHLITMHRYVSF